jgi:hypothetical protein
LGTFFARTKKVPRPRVREPATKKVQTKRLRRKIKNWIPAYAGMTEEKLDSGMRRSDGMVGNAHPIKPIPTSKKWVLPIHRIKTKIRSL